MWQVLSKALNVRAGEGAALLFLMAHLFFNDAAMVLLETASNALFLGENDVSSLPWVFVFTAAATIGLGLVYGRVEARWPAGRLFGVALGCACASLVGFWAGLVWGTGRGWSMALLVWKDTVWVLLNLEFWGLAGFLFDVRQGKRLFGLVGVGGVIAQILSGLAVPLIPAGVAVEHLVLGAAGCLVCSGGVLVGVVRRFGDSLTTQEEDEEEDGESFGSMLRQRYLQLLLAVSALSFLGFYLLEYAFFEQVEGRYAEPRALANFFGWYSAGLGVVSLVFGGVVSGPLLSRFGLRAGLLLMPGLMLGISTGTLGAGWVGAAAWVFWLVVATKFVNDVLGEVLEDPTLRILQQPYPSGQRLRVLTLRESIVEPAAMGLSGVALLVLTSVWGLGTAELVPLLVGVLVAWGALAVWLQREYTQVLSWAIDRRRLGGDALSLEDGSSAGVLAGWLEHGRPAQVIYCLRVLQEGEVPGVEVQLLPLLEHSDEAVRIEALRLLEDRHERDAAEAVRRCARSDASEAVRAAACRALCAILETDALEEVVPYLEQDGAVRKGAMVGLLRHGGIDGVLTAGAELNRLVQSPAAAERQFAAEVLGEVGIPSFYRPLRVLLDDSTPEVRRGALWAAGQLRAPALVEAVVEGVRSVEVAEAAVLALGQVGDRALTALEEELTREDASRAVRRRVLRACHRIGTPAARALLLRHVDTPDPDVRGRVYEVLVQLGHRATGEGDAVVWTRLQEEVRHAVWCLARWEGVGGGDATPVERALTHEFRAARRRVLALLAMICPARAVLRARVLLEEGVGEQRSNALELVDTLLRSERKGWVLPLLDDLLPSQRVLRLSKHVTPPTGTAEEHLEALVRWRDGSPWTRACAVERLGRLQDARFAPVVAQALEDAEPVVREVAVWALVQLDPDTAARRLLTLTDDPAPSVRELVRLALESQASVSLPRGARSLTRTARVRPDLFVRTLLDPHETPLRRQRAARALGGLPGSEGRSALVRVASGADVGLSLAALEALAQHADALQHEGRASLESALQGALADVLAAEGTAGAAPRGWDDVVAVVQEDARRARARVVWLVAILGEDKGLRARLGFGWSPGRLPEGGVEQVVAAAAPSLRERVAGALGGARGDGVAVRDLVVAPPRWTRALTRACALRRLVVEGAALEVSQVEALNCEEAGVLAETARWAVERLRSEGSEVSECC